MNSVQYFQYLSPKQRSVVASFIEENWEVFRNNAMQGDVPLSPSELVEIGEFVSTCQQPDLKEAYVEQQSSSDLNATVVMNATWTEPPDKTRCHRFVFDHLPPLVKGEAMLRGEDVRIDGPIKGGEGDSDGHK